VIIVFDITDKKSWKDVPYWIEQVKKYNTENPAILLVGNKSDLENERVVSTEEAQVLIKERKREREIEEVYVRMKCLFLFDYC
jgi:GTPase SAR1 family protein